MQEDNWWALSLSLGSRETNRADANQIRMVSLAREGRDDQRARNDTRSAQFE